MFKRPVALVALVVFVVSLTGCAGARRNRDMEMQGLRNQVTVLESQVKSKDEEIAGLRDSLSKMEKDKTAEVQAPSRKKKVIAEVKTRPNIKQIQSALINAGYNPGLADGKMGAQTRDAIKAFQKANNLPADGKVGKKTWSLLKDYLYKKTK